MGTPSAFLRCAAGAALGLVISCAPDIATDDDLPEILPFDPAAVPAQIPQPTHLVIDPATGLISFAAVGVQVPADCATASTMSQAQCEFYQYLEQLDGFPTDLEATVPASAAPTLASLTATHNLVAVDTSSGQLATDLLVRWDAATKQIAFVPKSGWEIGRSYHLGVRGYDDGIRSEQGKRFVSSVPYLLFKQTESLTCGATTAADLRSDCPFAALLAGPGISQEQLFRDLSDLEAIRVSYDKDLGLWDVLDSKGHLPKEQVAAAWSFPTHSSSVIELNPTLGKLPKVTSPQTIELQVKGPIDEDSLSVWALGGAGSVFLLDLTELEKMDLAKGIPAFAIEVEGSKLTLRTTAAMTDGHLMALLVTKEAKGGGRSLVAAPMTVLLRGRGKLLDEAGHSTVEGVSDADASQLEPGRVDLGLLLDDPLFSQLTKLAREDIVYVYAFTFPTP